MKKDNSQNIVQIGINYTDPLKTVPLDTLTGQEKEDLCESEESEQLLFSGMLSFY